MLKIAVVDHHLNNFHADKYADLLRGPLADADAAIVAAYESDPTAGDDWCRKRGVTRAESPEAAVRAADAVLLLAPDNIDAHPRLAASVLTAGKPVFLDKMLAERLGDAREIVALARRHGAPIYSCSALRHARELEKALAEIGREPVADVSAGGPGAWDRYGVHTVALALRLLGSGGSGVKRVSDTGTAAARRVTLDAGDDRRAFLSVNAAANEWDVFPWAFNARVRGDRYVAGKVADFDGFYHDQFKAVLHFFRSGQPPAPAEEALATVAVIEGAERSRRADGAWQTVAP